MGAGMNRFGLIIKYGNRQTTIHISRGQHLAQPIDLRMHDVHANITIILEPSSSATVHYGSIPEVSDTTIQRTIHFIIHEHASLTFRYDEEWQATVYAETEVIFEQKQASTVYYTHFVRSGARIKQRLSLLASEPQTHATIRGIYDMSGNGLVDMTSRQYHNAAHTQSNLLFKGVMRDTAQSIHHGMIEITKEGTYTESTQHMHTLLLSDAARAISVPMIEVHAHEVRCGHGSAIGRLDEEQLWYLQARGLSRTQAEQILINGFLNNVL